MRANLDDFRRRGATVEYHAVDVLDECALAHLVDDVEARHGAIDGVVHGAGVIEDKLLVDKTSESWSRVVETKVLGLLLLQRHLRPRALRFLSVFSSVAGRFGNSGQSDYATANELMNRLCCQLRDQWRGRVERERAVLGSVGPDDSSAPGMVTAETEAKFAAKGVTLVDAGVRPPAVRRGGRDASGRRRSRSSAARARGRRTKRAPSGAIAARGAAWRSPTCSGRSSAAAESPPLPTGEQRSRSRSTRVTRYLAQHRIDGVPVLPAAVAMEIMADAGAHAVAGLESRRGARLPPDQGRRDEGGRRARCRSSSQPPPYGSSEGFEVAVAIRSELGAGRSLVHYRAVLRLEQQLPAAFARTRRAARRRS